MTLLARFLIECQDQPGIIAGVTQFLSQQNANITYVDQHSTDPEGGQLFMRIECIADNAVEAQERLHFKQSFQTEVANRFQMKCRIRFSDEKHRLALLVSKYDHALLEVLWRFSIGDLNADIPLVISNHNQLRHEVERFGIPFYHIDVTPTHKKDAEEKILELLAQHHIDVIGLARYMQILSGEFVKTYPMQIINVHHSFLPAFIGANPYAQAYARGVKIIGATAHYVTEDLDQGPIIAQDIVHVSHRDNTARLTALGRDIERRVFVEALRWHTEDRILVHENKTIVFD